MANQDMGIGVLGFKNQVFKRKFRYTFEVFDVCDGNQGHSASVPPGFVKVAARPHLSIEETELNFLNAKIWIPGKASWNTMSVTYIDAATESLKPLYNWLSSVYNFSGSIQGNIASSRPERHQQGSKAYDYAGTGILKLWDGCGGLLETWIYEQVWPTDVDFGELDYTSSDTADITLTFRYNDVSYSSDCPPYTPNGCCSGCQAGHE